MAFSVLGEDVIVTVGSSNTSADALNQPGFDSVAAGRWVMPLHSMVCRFDPALLRLVGMPSQASSMPLDEYLNHTHADDAAKLRLLAQEVAETHCSFDVTFRLLRPDNGQFVWINSRGHVDLDRNGDPAVFGTNYDVTAFKQREEQSRLVAGEMSHRIKNLLTVVQSLFRMSAIRANSVDQLRDSFSARLSALRALNDVIMNPAIGLTTDQLLASVLGPVLADQRMEIKAEPIGVNEEAAQTLCLCLNELMTNAIKHGALLHQNGKVIIELQRDQTGESFSLSWREIGGTAPKKPPNGAGGFGFTMLNDMTRMSLDGRPEIVWHADGLHFRCDWPAAKFCTMPAAERPAQSSAG